MQLFFCPSQRDSCALTQLGNKLIRLKNAVAASSGGCNSSIPFTTV